MVYEATATGERSSPFGDHPDGYLSYSADGRMYAIGVVEDRPKPCDPVPTDDEKSKNSKRACSAMQERIRQTVRR